MQGSATTQVNEATRDRELVERVIAGDTQAYAELYDVYEHRIFVSCMRVCGNPDDAADATQEAFATLLRRLPELRLTNVGGYLFVVSRNASLEIIRRRAKAVPRAELPEYEEQEPVAAEDDPERALLVKDQRRMVKLANKRLAPRQREALLLREVNGLSYDEVAGEMKTSVRAVAGLVFRARGQLRGAVRDLAALRVALDADCRRAQPILSRYVDGELGETKLEWLKDHLSGCEECSADLEAVEEVGATFRSVAPWIAAPGAAMFLGVDQAKAAVTAHAGNGGTAHAGAVDFGGSRQLHLSASGRRALAAGAAVAVVGIALLISAGPLDTGNAGPVSGGRGQMTLGVGGTLGAGAQLLSADHPQGGIVGNSSLPAAFVAPSFTTVDGGGASGSISHGSRSGALLPVGAGSGTVAHDGAASSTSGDPSAVSTASGSDDSSLSASSSPISASNEQQAARRLPPSGSSNRSGGRRRTRPPTHTPTTVSIPFVQPPTLVVSSPPTIVSGSSGSSGSSGDSGADADFGSSRGGDSGASRPTGTGSRGSSTGSSDSRAGR